MKTAFCKMQSLGNDFVVFDGVGQRLRLRPDTLARIADRRFGVGCDQILLVEPGDGAADFRFRIFNQDGGEVGQCGNGARCLARFLRQQNLWRADTVTLQTQSTRMQLQIHADESVTVNMGAPAFAPEKIPLAAARAPLYRLRAGCGEVTFAALSLGNPHAVFALEQFGGEMAKAPVAELGAELQQHAMFPERVNVGFAQIRSRRRLDLRVYERGVGETLGCGSGACAAAAAGIARGLLDAEVAVHLPGGAVTVNWAGSDAPLFLRGSAESVFNGEIDLPAERV